MTRFPYLVKIRRLLAVLMLGGLAVGAVVAVGTHRAGYSDGWAALGQMFVLAAGILTTFYLFCRLVTVVARKAFPLLPEDFQEPAIFPEFFAGLAAFFLPPAALLLLTWPALGPGSVFA